MEQRGMLLHQQGCLLEKRQSAAAGVLIEDQFELVRTIEQAEMERLKQKFGIAA